jgi:hypothetical protein
VLDFEFDLNSMKVEIFDSITRFTTMIRVQTICLNLRDATKGVEFNKVHARS